MARPIDEEKLKKLKRGVRQLIVEDGYKGVGISKLSKLTGISAGYLYMYYNNKDELINAAMEDVINEGSEVLVRIVRKTNSVEAFVTAVYKLFMQLTEEEYVESNFFIKMLLDPSLRELSTKLILRMKEVVFDKLEGDLDGMLPADVKIINEQVIIIALTNIAISHKLKLDYMKMYETDYPISDENILKSILALCGSIAVEV